MAQEVLERSNEETWSCFNLHAGQRFAEGNIFLSNDILFAILDELTVFFESG
jgi:hypothetical protein